MHWRLRSGVIGSYATIAVRTIFPDVEGIFSYFHRRKTSDIGQVKWFLDASNAFIIYFIFSLTWLAYRQMFPHEKCILLIAILASIRLLFIDIYISPLALTSSFTLHSTASAHFLWQRYFALSTIGRSWYARYFPMLHTISLVIYYLLFYWYILAYHYFFETTIRFIYIDIGICCFIEFLSLARKCDTTSSPCIVI